MMTFALSLLILLAPTTAPATSPTTASVQRSSEAELRRIIASLQRQIAELRRENAELRKHGAVPAASQPRNPVPHGGYPKSMDARDWPSQEKDSTIKGKTPSEVIDYMKATPESQEIDSDGNGQLEWQHPVGGDYYETIIVTFAENRATRVIRRTENLNR